MIQQFFHHFIMFEIRINGWSPHLYSYLFKKYFLSIDDFFTCYIAIQLVIMSFGHVHLCSSL